MLSLLDRFGDAITSVLHGFDRVVFKGRLSGLMFPDGASAFLSHRGVLHKDLSDWMQDRTQEIVDAVQQQVVTATGREITYLSSSRTRKEDEARSRQKELGIDSGIVGAWSCVEAGQSFRVVYQPGKGYPGLRYDHVRCKHLYLYLEDPCYGWMALRLQTWLPYHIQVSINGREWLRRQLDGHGIGYERSANKFIAVDDPLRAQQCLDAQPRIEWFSALDALVPLIFPGFAEIVDRRHYEWTIWQSEWASDYLCHTPQQAQEIMLHLLNHAVLTGTADRVIRYFARPVSKASEVPQHNRNDIRTGTKYYHDGARVRHWIDANSVKAYNEANILRIETTINQPGMFQVMRHVADPHRKDLRQPPPPDAQKRRMQLRKSVADTTLRAHVAQEVNDRFAAHLATCVDTTPFSQLTERYSKARTVDGKRVRALELFGKDRDLIVSLGDPAHNVTGLTNATIKKALCGTSWAAHRTDKQLTARISRHLRLLRHHGIIRKVPGRNRYLVTENGQKTALALMGALQSSTQELTRVAA